MSYQNIIEKYKQLDKQDCYNSCCGTLSGPPAARTLSFLRHLETMVALDDMDDNYESMV